MKDPEVESEESWEVAEEYFTKELEKDLAQHKADERILRYKLETYQKNFPKFIYNSPTSIKVSGQDVENEVGHNEATQEEEVQTREPQDLKSGAIHEEEVQLEKPKTLKEGVKKKKNHK